MRVKNVGSGGTLSNIRVANSAFWLRLLWKADKETSRSAARVRFDLRSSHLKSGLFGYRNSFKLWVVDIMKENNILPKVNEIAIIRDENLIFSIADIPALPHGGNDPYQGIIYHEIKVSGIKWGGNAYLSSEPFRYYGESQITKKGFWSR